MPRSGWLIVRVLLGVAGFLTVVVSGGRSHITTERMIEDVNSKLPEDQRFAPYWWWAGEYWRLLNEYRRLYPDGPTIHQLRRQHLVGSLGLAVAASAIGFPFGLVLLLLVTACVSALLFYP